MSFNENLKKIRKEKYTGTVKSFAEDILKISYKTYHGYEIKDALPPESTIIKIAKALNVSICCCNNTWGEEVTASKLPFHVTYLLLVCKFSI